jgi:hypothetical protein
LPLAGKTVTFSIGADQATGVTGADGVAHATVPLSSPPGTSLLSAGFAGDAGFGPSGASSTFPVNQAGTNLTISGPSSAQVGTPSGVTALLKSGTTPLSFKTVWFVLTGPSTVTVAADTNLVGVASLGNAPSIGGQYTITACFSPDPLSLQWAASLDAVRPGQEGPPLPRGMAVHRLFSPVDNLPSSTSPPRGAGSLSSSARRRSASTSYCGQSGHRQVHLQRHRAYGRDQETDSTDKQPRIQRRPVQVQLKTLKSYAGSCYQFQLKPVDGTTYIANFQFAALAIIGTTPERSPLRRLHARGNHAGPPGVSATVIKWRAVHWKMPS